jgi:hypothetical protein
MRHSDPQSYTNQVLRALQERGGSTYQEVHLFLKMLQVAKLERDTLTTLTQLVKQGRASRESKVFTFVRWETRRQLERAGRYTVGGD